MDIQSTNMLLASQHIQSNGGEVEERILKAIDLVCKRRGVSADQLFGRSRKEGIIESRFCCFYLLSVAYSMGASRIARAWGYDESSVRSGLLKFMDWLDINTSLRRELRGLMEELESGSPQPPEGGFVSGERTHPCPSQEGMPEPIKGGEEK